MISWELHVERWKDCTLCPLHKQRDRIVLAKGTVPCDILFCGEAPGASEDALGLPFVGPAGKRLDWLIEQAILSTVSLAYCNLTCCFPALAKARGDNEPEREEILACRPRLDEFINVAQPRLIVCVGSLATEYVDHSGTVPCADIVHPAATFHMKAVQAQQVLQHAVVVLRNAVEDMLQKPRCDWVEWGMKRREIHAGKSKREQIAAAYDEAIADADGTPF